MLASTPQIGKVLAPPTDGGGEAPAPQPGSLRARLRSGIAWNVCGTLIGQSGSFIGNVLLANILGRYMFGEFSLLQNTVVTFAGLAQLSAGYTAGKYVAEFRNTDKPKAGRILGLCYLMSGVMGLLGGALMFALAPWLATVTVRAPHLTTEFRILALFLPFSVVAGTLNGALAGLESFRSNARSAITFGLGYVSLCGVGAGMLGQQGAAIGLVAAAAIQCLVVNWMLIRESKRQQLPIILHGFQQELGILWSFSLPAVLSGFSSVPAMWFASVCLARQPDGFSQLALFSAAASLKGVVMFLPNNINTVTLSLLNNHLSPGLRAAYRKIFIFGLFLNCVVVVTGAVAAFLFGPMALRAYGKSFVEGHLVLLIMLVAALPEVLAVCVYQIIQSKAQMWRSLLSIAIPKDLSLAVAALILTPIYGAAGLAIAIGIGWSVNLACSSHLARWCWNSDREHKQESEFNEKHKSP